MSIRALGKLVWWCFYVCWTSLIYRTLCDPMGYIYSPPASSIHGILQAGILEWGCHVLLQGIFPTQGSNPGLLHWRQMLYPLSQQGGKPHLSGRDYKMNHLKFSVTHVERCWSGLKWKSLWNWCRCNNADACPELVVFYLPLWGVKFLGRLCHFCFVIGVWFGGFFLLPSIRLSQWGALNGAVFSVCAVLHSCFL